MSWEHNLAGDPYKMHVRHQGLLAGPESTYDERGYLVMKATGTVRITVYFINDEQKSLVVSRGNRGPIVPTYADEEHKTYHFGRWEDGRWHELMAAPVSSVIRWDVG